MNIIRVNVCVPIALKERMRAVNRQINWSAVAVRAFEDCLDGKDPEKRGKRMDQENRDLRARIKTLESRLARIATIARQTKRPPATSG